MASEVDIAPDEVDTQRRRAFVASGLGWGLDGFDWTMFAYALHFLPAAPSPNPVCLGVKAEPLFLSGEPGKALVKRVALVTKELPAMPDRGSQYWAPGVISR